MTVKESKNRKHLASYGSFQSAPARALSPHCSHRDLDCLDRHHVAIPGNLPPPEFPAVHLPERKDPAAPAGCIASPFNSWVLVVTLAYTHVKSSPSLKALHKGDTQEDWKAIFLLVLFELQVLRRLYESIYVSKFSGNARMHVLAYLLGLIYYVMIPLSIFPRAREIMIELGRWPYHENSGKLVFEFNCREILNYLLRVGWLHWIGAALFIWGSIHQHHCHRILAALRQDTGLSKRENREYKIPYGDWFEYVSSAHYFAEIVIYFSFIVALAGKGLDVWLLFIFVILNLSIAAQDTHKWYKSKFEGYPPNRKAIVPLIY